MRWIRTDLARCVTIIVAATRRAPRICECFSTAGCSSRCTMIKPDLYVMVWPHSPLNEGPEYIALCPLSYSVRGGGEIKESKAGECMHTTYRMPACRLMGPKHAPSRNSLFCCSETDQTCQPGRIGIRWTQGDRPGTPDCDRGKGITEPVLSAQGKSDRGTTGERAGTWDALIFWILRGAAAHCHIPGTLDSLRWYGRLLPMFRTGDRSRPQIAIRSREIRCLMPCRERW